MRHSIVLRATTLALVLGWAQSQAAEGEYPAAHFEPEVIYQAPEAVSSVESPAPTTDADYPAAHFEPKVIYQDPTLIESVRAQPVPPPAAAPAETERSPAAAPKANAPGGPVSDVSPPYGVLAFALGIIGLAFWWSTRARTPEIGESAEGGDTEAVTETAVDDDAGEAADDDAGEAEDEELEELAEAAVASLAHTNRQRANKTRRVRRR